MAISIESLDFVGASEVPFEFQVKNAAGNPMDLRLKIVGDDAERVQKFMCRKMNENRRATALSTKKGKAVEFAPAEDDFEFIVENALIRLVGWDAQEPFSEERARVVLQRNKHIRIQIMEESANAANFTQTLPES